MKKNYSEKEVQRLHARGYSIRQIAEATGMSKSSVGRMVKKPQQSPVGTAPGTRPNNVPHQVSQTVPGTGKTAVGTMKNVQNSAPAHAVATQQDTQQEESGWNDWAKTTFLKHVLAPGYRDFLRYIDTFLSGDQRNEDLARSQSRDWQRMVRERIFSTRGHCAQFQVNYDGLFMAYVLERLHVYLGQEPVLERTKRQYQLDEVRVKKDPFIELLLEQGKKADVFAPRQDFITLFPDVHSR